MWLWEEKKGKRNLRWCPLIPACSCVFRYTKRYHMFDSCNMGLFFFARMKNQRSQYYSSKRKKKFTKSNWDKGYTQRTPWPSVRIGHYMLDDLAAAGSRISRAVSDQTKQRRWIGRGKNKKTILSISVKERKKSVLCYLDGALDPMTHRPAHRSDVGSTFSCIYYRLGRSLQVLAATGKQIPVQCRLGMWAS